MIPTGLKIGDVFEEPGRYGVIRNVIIGFDGQGNYISKPFEGEAVAPVEDVIEEELPFTMPDDELVEEQPAVEEVKEVKEEKKPTPKKAVRKKTAAKKPSKK